MRSMVIIITTLIAAVLLASTAIGATPTITVPGEGTVTVSADQVLLSISASSSNENATMAAMEAEEKLTDVLDSLKDEGLRDEEVIPGYSTSINQNVFTTKECSRGEDNNTTCKTVTKYTTMAIEEARIKLKASDKVRMNKIIDSANAAGAQAVVSGYRLTDTSDAKSKALKTAEKDAKARATSLASSVGGRVGKVLDITEASYPEMFFSMSLMGSDMFMPFDDDETTEPGKVRITAYVIVTYELLQ